MSQGESTVAVEIPQRILDRAEDRLPQTDWENPAEYITFAVEEVLNRIEREPEDDDFEPADEDEVKDRLKSLGYLNG